MPRQHCHAETDWNAARIEGRYRRGNQSQPMRPTAAKAPPDYQVKRSGTPEEGQPDCTNEQRDFAPQFVPLAPRSPSSPCSQ